MELGWEKVSNWLDDIKMAERNQNMTLMWKKLMQNVDIDEPTSLLDHVYLGCTERECKPNETIVEWYTKMLESRILAGATEKYWGGKIATVPVSSLVFPDLYPFLQLRGLHHPVHEHLT